MAFYDGVWDWVQRAWRRGPARAGHSVRRSVVDPMSDAMGEHPWMGAVFPLVVVSSAAAVSGLAGVGGVGGVASTAGAGTVSGGSVSGGLFGLPAVSGGTVASQAAILAGNAGTVAGTVGGGTMAVQAGSLFSMPAAVYSPAGGGFLSGVSSTVSGITSILNPIVSLGKSALGISQDLASSKLQYELASAQMDALAADAAGRRRLIEAQIEGLKLGESAGSGITGQVRDFVGSIPWGTVALVGGGLLVGSVVLKGDRK